MPLTAGGASSWRHLRWASTVIDIQRMIERHGIHCAILDFGVDGKSRLPIADLLAFAYVPFVFLTTGVFEPLPCEHRHSSVVEKPLTPDVLIAAVEKGDDPIP